MAASNPPRAYPASMESSPSIADELFVLPASVAQQRFWLLDQLEPGNTSLNMPLALRLSGALDITALERTLNEILARHEVLRTTFMFENDKLAQVIARETWLSLDVVDISDLSEAEREERARCLMIDEAHITFHLARGPLFKAKLLALGAEDHILLLTLHHIICDGWSNGVLVRELGEIYDALSKGQSSSLAELPIQYGDFAVWQQEWLESNGFDEQLEYWKHQLGSELPTLELPTDFPRRKNRTSFGAIESLLIPPALTRALKALGQHEDVTLFTIFLAAFKVLLHRYSCQNNILVGSPTANRIQGQTEGLIGAFANTLLLKTDLSGNPSFRETLQLVKEVSLGALLNQTLPFEKLVEQIKPAQSRSSTQLFQVLFVFQTAFMQPVELSDLTMTPMRSVSPGSIFELSLGVVERAEGTRLQLEYNTDLFEADTIKGILGNLQSILRSAVTDIRQKISDIVLPTSPPTFQGTIDGQPLRSPDATSQMIAGVRDDEPRDPAEATLIEIWKEVLHASPIGIRDDFFELGGHSLLATQVISRVRETFQVNLPLRALLEAPTVAELSKVIATLTQKERTRQMPPLVPGDRRADLPLSFAQQRLWFLDQLEGGSAYIIPAAIRLEGPLDIQALSLAIEEIVTRHESLRTSFGTAEEIPFQRIVDCKSIPLPVVDLTNLPEAEREAQARRLAAEEINQPFDLAGGMLLRAKLIKTSANQHVLVFAIHHIASDGWSIGVLFRELSALYNAFAAGRTSPLSPLPIQYADYAVWQLQWLQGDVLDKLVSYWKRQLADAPQILQLPTDRPRPPVQTFRGAHESLTLSPDLTGALRKLSQEQGVTLFMMCLAAYQLLLSRWTGQADFIVGTDVANRNQREIEPLIGFFTNLLPLRARVSGQLKFSELLRQVRATSLEAYAHQELPFQKMVEELRPARDLSRNPFVQVLLVMQNEMDQEIEMSQLNCSRFGLPIERCRFDLALFLSESERGVRGMWLYNHDLFDMETILNLSMQYEKLLVNILRDPTARLDSYAIFDENTDGRKNMEKRQTQLSGLRGARRKGVDLSQVNQWRVE